MADQYVGTNVVIAEYDADAEHSIPQKYGVGGYPTLKFFPGNAKADTPMPYSGGRDLSSFQEFIEKSKQWSSG